MNRQAGFLWESHIFLGFETLYMRVAGRERVRADLSINPPLPLPVSISALPLDFVQQRVPIRNQDDMNDAFRYSTYMITTTLLSLIAQDVITLWRMNLFGGRNHELVTDGSQYLLAPGPRMDQINIQGELEQRITQIVRQESGSINVFDPPKISGTATKLGTFFESREINDMAYEVYKTSMVFSTYYDNIIRIVLQDAIAFNIAVKTSPRQRRFGVALTEGGIARLQHYGAIVAQAYADTRSQHPQLIEGLERQIRLGLLRRQDTGD